MFRFRTIGIYTISLTISIIVFCSIELISFGLKTFNQKSKLKAGFQVEQVMENLASSSTQEIIANSTQEEIEILKNEEQWSWYLEIPIINLKAPIEEGTTKEVMDIAIGHFEETQKNTGNIGLAAHNRGYEKNYFENLKNLKEGDEIYYYYQTNKRKYIVTDIGIIKDTDWSYLEETEENRITLITCVENQPEYRRYVQGIEEVK